jgi:hypothetical protein
VARRGANPSGAIYGTILATALITAASGHEDDPGRIALTVGLSLLVFWLAHVYTDVLEHGLRHAELHPTVVRATMVREFALVEAPVVSLAILAVGGFGWIDPHLSVTLALANGIVQLLLWGVTLARRLGRPWPSALLVGLVNTLFGLVVVALKTLLH